MQLWIVLITLLTTTPTSDFASGLELDNPEPVRYRGIEQLLAKFDAQVEDG